MKNVHHSENQYTSNNKRMMIDVTFCCLTLLLRWHNIRYIYYVLWVSKVVQAHWNVPSLTRSSHTWWIWHAARIKTIKWTLDTVMMIFYYFDAVRLVHNVDGFRWLSLHILFKCFFFFIFFFYFIAVSSWSESDFIIGRPLIL